MAIRASPKLLQNLRHCNSAAAALPTLVENSDRCTSQSVINFDDHGQRPFASIPTNKLLNSYLNLQLVALDPVVDVGVRLVRSSLMENSFFRKAMLSMLKRTVYAHFCAGEDVEEAKRTLEGLWQDGLRGILDYGLEDAVDNSGCDANLDEFLRTVEMASMLPANSVSFACVKISAICPISLLERVSDLLRWNQKNPYFDLPWQIDSLPILSSSSPIYHTRSKPDNLTEAEEHDLQLARLRLSKLCQKCVEKKLPLLIDAEYTSIQPAIDYLTFSAAIRFNKEENPVVYGTIQAYLRDAKERLVQATEVAESMGVSMGFKLVRGAYITRETLLASSLGVASPIHPSIQDTHSCYNDCASFMIEKIAGGYGSVVLATHNIGSGKVLAAKVDELKIGRGNQRLQFAQLKGMADGLSYGLRDAGFNVSKYLSFGPVEQVIPYLLRRAEENKGLLSSSSLDRQLIRMELKKRLKAAISGEPSTRS
ncbi:proline dehydrogenase 1, mitochondrial-like [Aristolochia californica]|uniref:proline dehydrogenase 1, mitochondrial-like n=1 Tax=Aristolochia californica TaxID=171875 RepID=UPI0035D52BF6